MFSNCQRESGKGIGKEGEGFKHVVMEKEMIMGDENSM